MLDISNRERLTISETIRHLESLDSSLERAAERIKRSKARDSEKAMSLAQVEKQRIAIAQAALALVKG